MRPLSSLSAVTGRPEAHPTGTTRSGWRDSDLAGVFGRRPISMILATCLSLALGACAADEIGVRATLADYGLHGVGVTIAPAFGRPCRLGEPFAARFTAHDERGRSLAGWLCATDEAAQDARILFDQGAV